MQTSGRVIGRRGAHVIQRPLALALALSLGLTPLAGMAATIIVKSSGDVGSAGTCTVRQAVVSMNTGSVAGTSCVNTGAPGFHTNDIINFDVATFPSGGANTITLADDSTSTLSISDAHLTIDASANGQVTIQRPSGAANNFGIIYQGQPDGGSLTLNHLILSNGSGTSGGGIRNPFANGHLTLLNSTLSGNSAGAGGGVASDGYLLVINSTLSGNSASRGGGIYSRNTIVVSNSTLSGNVASMGGGIYSELGNVTVTNSTISANTASDNISGGILNLNGAGPKVINSIVAGNNGGDLRYLPGAGSSGNFIGGNPQLGALANNGGSTATMVPLPGSPVIDAIACTSAPATDQRGVVRPQGVQCDIGAVEATPMEATSPPAIVKVFGAATIPLGGTTSLTFTLANPNAAVPLAGVAFTDSLPAGLVVATPNGATKTCNGTAAALPGGSSVTLSGATLAGGASCTMTVAVTGTTPGVKNNSVQASSINSGNGGIGNTSNATLTVSLSPPTIAKVFGAATIPLGSATSLTFTLTNPNPYATLTGVAFTDSMPAGLVVGTPNGLSNTCGGTATAVAGASSASLSGATLAAGASCTVAVGVTATTAGVKNNTVHVNSTNGGAGIDSNATLAVSVSPPSISKVFGAASIPLGSTTSLTFTVTNPNAYGALTGVAFSDILAAAYLHVALPNGLTNTCGGTVTAAPGDSLVVLSGATLAAAASCTVVVGVTAMKAGYVGNNVQVNSANGGTGNTSNAILHISGSPPAIKKVFGAASIAPDSTTSLTFTLTNPNSYASLTGVAFTDELPEGLVVATPNGLTNTCGGTATADPGAASADLSGATLAAVASCTMAVVVQATTLGVKNNSVEATSTEGGLGASSSATLTVGQQQVSMDLSVFEPYGGLATYGQTTYYFIQLVNAGASTSSSIAVTLSSELDAANATLGCNFATGGATCGASGGHVLSDTVALPQNGAVYWQLGVPVLASAVGTTVEVDVSASGATPATINLIDTLVILRNGFEENPFAMPQTPKDPASEVFMLSEPKGNAIADVYKSQNGNVIAPLGRQEWFRVPFRKGLHQ